MKQMILTIILILGLVAGVLAYTTAQNVIKNQAIDGCLHAGLAKFKNPAGQDVEVPDGYWYEFCMKEKGMTVKK
ncbi:MAG TPA: hypothetical protein VLG67_01350 [Candidatus Saccharimonadales bacterium]|nr:hypothetical protein [Candidatus Saccharimonadales bacterium]